MYEVQCTNVYILTNAHVHAHFRLMIKVFCTQLECAGIGWRLFSSNSHNELFLLLFQHLSDDASVPRLCPGTNSSLSDLGVTTGVCGVT